jgi:hypothetical protein
MANRHTVRKQFLAVVLLSRTGHHRGIAAAASTLTTALASGRPGLVSWTAVASPLPTEPSAANVASSVSRQFCFKNRGATWQIHSISWSLVAGPPEQ